MKKLILFTMLISLLIFCTACGSSQTTSTDDTNKEDTTKELDYVLGDGSATIWEGDSGNKCVFAYIPITNNGTKNLSYDSISILIEDENGPVADPITDATFAPAGINPGDTGYIYYIGEIDASVTGSDFTVTCESINISYDSTEYAEYETSDIKYYSKNGFLLVEGNITNNTGTDCNEAFIEFLFFDKEDKFLGYCIAGVENLTNGTSQTFIGTTPDEIKNPNFIPDNVGRYEVISWGI